MYVRVVRHRTTPARAGRGTPPAPRYGLDYRGNVPKVRANWLKLIIGAAKRQSPATRDAFLAELPPELRPEIRKMGMLAWVDTDAFVEVTRAVHRGLGEDDGCEFWRATMLDSLDRPLLRPIRDGAIGMFGRSPSSLFRFSKQAWSLVTRDLCRVRFEVDDASSQVGSGGHVHFEDIATQIEPAPFSLFCRGAAQAVLDVLEYEGQIHLREIDERERRITVEARWQDRSLDSSAR